MTLQERFGGVHAEWLAISRPASPDVVHFARVKQNADAIINAGRWVSGPPDMMSVLGRQRDELAHSRMIAWLLTPTGRHGLGRSLLRTMLDHVWPGEGLLQSDLVAVETESTRSAADEVAELREARADIVVIGQEATIVIENKVDAGEGFEQCERLYWSWADRPTETRWLFLSPNGRQPVTLTSTQAKTAWRSLSYGDLGRLLTKALAEARDGADPMGRSTAHQYLASIARVAVD
ncbi:MAG: hypothetical protein QOJ81_1751 [Chloroflexota bacterium]|jgi:hypothetical protein|nr:hypothetical protein [Chloroflexota bacterium]